MKPSFVLIGWVIALAAALAIAGVPIRVDAATATVPQRMIYNGHLLDASGNAVTTAHTIRFSFWTSADFLDGDVSGTGAVNTASALYADWQETHTVTPDARGYFTVELGSGTTLPDFATLPVATLVNLHLQVEVKEADQAESAYELLDVNASDAAVDRAPLRSVPFALNADLLDGRHTGTASGSVPLLETNDQLNVTTIPGGTNAEVFSLDHDNSTIAGSIVLQFGESLTKELSYDLGNARFNFNDDLRVEGGIGATGSVTAVSFTASGTIKTESGLVINKDNEARDAVLVFGNDAGQETLKFVDGTHRFEFSDDLSVAGDLFASGSLAIESHATVGGNLTVNGLINGIDITSLSGNDSDTHLKVSSGAGLTIAIAAGDYRLGGVTTHYNGLSGIAVADNATNYVFLTATGVTVTTAGFTTDKNFIQLATVVTSGGAITTITDRRVFNANDTARTMQVVEQPLFHGASYQGDGSENVGQLSVNHSGALLRNYYRWTSTRTTLQDYDILLKITLPDDFVKWAATPLSVSYRSSSADSSVAKMDIALFDTAGNEVSLSGDVSNLASTAWTTTTPLFTGAPVWTPGGDVLLRFRVFAKDSGEMNLGTVTVQYREMLSE
ncbi:MAG: hypothetical protein V1926_06485 [Candidatus Peregrinibacteria bacterium]